MSSDATASRGELIVDVLKATKLPLFAGVVGMVVFLAMWYYGLPWRLLTLVVLVLSVGGPFIAAYSMLFTYLIRRRSRVPVLIADEDQSEIALRYFTPSEFAEIDVEGDELATRDSAAGKVYIAEEYRREQTEAVDEDGTESTELRRVLETTWEGALSSWEWVERRDAFKEWREEVVPIARQAIEARASADAKALQNSDQLGHALIAGAEEDNSFIADMNQTWDVDADLDDLEDELPAEDEEADHEDKPDPGDLAMQDGDGSQPDADGGGHDG